MAEGAQEQKCENSFTYKVIYYIPAHVNRKEKVLNNNASDCESVTLK